METPEDFTIMFNDLADKIKDHYYYGLNAAVYTQLSDVEIEKNGIYTYDRRILKPYSPTGELKDKILECINMPQSDVKIQPVVSTAKEQNTNGSSSPKTMHLATGFPKGSMTAYGPKGLPHSERVHYGIRKDLSPYLGPHRKFTCAVGSTWAT